MAQIVHAAVEGKLDKIIAEQIIRFAGGDPGRIFVMGGKANLRKKIAGYNLAATHQPYPWLILVDLDREAECAPAMRNRWFAHQSPASRLCFCVAVRSVEAWLIADRHNMAKFLGISETMIPDNPENLPDPKQEIIRLAKRSRRIQIKKALVPDTGSGQQVGPLYTSLMGRFAEELWDIRRACQTAPSLQRAVRCLQRMLQILRDA